MARTQVQVIILNESRTLDAGGGISRSGATSPTGIALVQNDPLTYTVSQRFRRPMSDLARFEGMVGAYQGPGTMDILKMVVIFEFVPYPNVLQNDWIQRVDTGEKWRVLYVRKYDRTMQCDVEVVK